MAAVAPKTDGGHNLGTADLRWGTVYTGNVNASGNVTISGNLSIIGNASEINVDNLSVAEPLIKLADGNSADTIDIGIYAQYNDGQDKYSVLYRDASDGKWKLATGLTEEPVPGSDIDLTGLSATTLVVDVLESNTLTGTDANGDVTVTPNGTGHVLLVTDTVCLGESGDASVSLITPTDVDLVVRTGDPEADPADNSGSITINAGDNGNIDITPHGTGEVNISKVDIDGGAIDGTAIGANSASSGVFTDLTSTGTSTHATVDINGGAIDGVTIGTNSAVTDLRVDNLQLDGNSITSTDVNGDISLTPNGTGEVNISKVDIDSGAIDGTAIGANSASTGEFTDLTSTGTSTHATVDINGGAIDGVTIGTNSAVTDLRVDNLQLDGNSITSTDVNGDISLTPNGTGEVNISKVDIDSGAIDGTAIGANSASTGEFTDLTSTGTSTHATVDINGGAIDGTAIGANSASSGVFTDLTSTGTSTHATVDINGGTIDGTSIGATQASTGKFTNVELSGTLDIGNTGNITISRSNNAALTIRSSDSSTNYVIIDTQDDDAGLNVFGKLNLTKGLQLGVTTPSDNTELDITRSVVLLGDNIDVTLPAAANHEGRQFIVIVTGTSVTLDHANGTDAIYHNGAEQVSGGAWSLSQHDTYTFISSGSAWYSV